MGRIRTPLLLLQRPYDQRYVLTLSVFNWWLCESVVPLYNSRTPILFYPMSLCLFYYYLSYFYYENGCISLISLSITINKINSTILFYSPLYFFSIITILIYHSLSSYLPLHHLSSPSSFSSPRWFFHLFILFLHLSTDFLAPHWYISSPLFCWPVWAVDGSGRSMHKLVRTLTGHAHRINSLALNCDYVLRTGAFQIGEGERNQN